VKTYLKSGEVDHIVDIRVLVKDPVESLLIGDISLEEWGLLATYELNTVEDFCGGVVEVISDHDFVVSFQECKCCK
jgi:hypothetical protein